MDNPDDIRHLKQLQARQGLAIGGIKSHMHGLTSRVGNTESRLYNVETAALAIGVFIAVFFPAAAIVARFLP